MMDTIIQSIGDVMIARMLMRPGTSIFLLCLIIVVTVVLVSWLFAQDE